jgi:hypothetical protein
MSGIVLLFFLFFMTGCLWFSYRTIFSINITFRGDTFKLSLLIVEFPLGFIDKHLIFCKSTQVLQSNSWLKTSQLKISTRLKNLYELLSICILLHVRFHERVLKILSRQNSVKHCTTILSRTITVLVSIFHCKIKRNI